MKVLTLSGGDLSLEILLEVVRDKRPIEISQAAKQRLEDGRALIYELMDQGVAMYGCNTGVGWNKDISITDELLEKFNRGMLHSHAVGLAPFTTEEESRAVLLLRLNTLLYGCTGISVHIPQMYVEFLNRGISPIVPTRGSVGQADVGLLPFVGLAMIGIGDVYYKGEQVKASFALEQEGLSPIALGPKDGLAIISSNALAAGVAALALQEANELIQSAELIYCLSLEGVNGNVTPLKLASVEKRGFHHPLVSAKAMAEHLEGSDLYQADSKRPLQDPLSYRNGAYLHGEMRRAIAKAKEQLEIQFNFSDDNPCLNLEDRTVSSCSNFAPMPWVLEMQALSVCLSHLSKASCMRMLKLINPSFTGGLARNLQPSSSVMAFTTIHKTYSLLDAEIRNLCNPVSMDGFAISGEMEDINTNSALVVGNLKKIMDNLRYILGMELILASQAIDLREGQVLGKHTNIAHQTFREHIAFYDDDNRVLMFDIEKAKELIEAGVFIF